MHAGISLSRYAVDEPTSEQRWHRLLQAITSLALGLIFVTPAASHAAATERASAALPGFDRIDIDLVGDIALRKGAAHGYSIVAERKVIDAVTFHVNNGELQVRAVRNFKTDQPIKIEITAITLKRVRLGGSETAVSEVPTQSTFEARTDGSGTFRASNVAATSVTALATGSGDIELAGQTEQLSVIASGSGDAVLDRLTANQVRVESAGSSTVRVHAKRSLNATITGAGTVAYRGSPVVTQSINGAGEVVRLGR